MVRSSAVLLLAVSVSVLLIAGGAVSAGAFQLRCVPWSVSAQVGGKRVCLNAGQRCLPRLEVQYRRYGFVCTKGRLTRRSEWVVSDLGVVGAGSVTAINQQGQVIGERGQRVPGVYLPYLHAFIWQSGRMRELAPTATYSVAAGINDAGQIIGWSCRSCGPAPQENFLWQNGVVTDLGGLRAAAINASGQIIGDEATAAGVHAFLWENGVPTDLGFEGNALAVNNRGQVVARSNVSPGDTVVWENGVTTDLGALQGFIASAINAKGQILGQADSATGKIRAFLWDSGVLRDLGSLDGGQSFPRAINDSGQVIGQSSFASTAGHNQLRAFLWQDGVMRNLGTLGTDSNPSALNDRGEVVGLSQTATGPHAFIWKQGHMSDLGGLPGRRFSAAVDINDHDQIVGVSWGSDAQMHAVMWTRRRGR